MSKYVAFWVQGEILDRPHLDLILEKLVRTVQENEPDTSHYEWSVSDDESQLFVFERYADSEAALVHLGGFADVAEEFAKAVRTLEFAVFGYPSVALREVLDPSNPKYATQIAGFSR